MRSLLSTLLSKGKLGPFFRLIRLAPSVQLDVALESDVAQCHSEVRQFPGSWSFACLEFLYLNRSIVLQLDGMGPLYRQIYRAFCNDILTRVLAPGERVPSTRALADLLKVSRNTAVLTYRTTPCGRLS